MPRNARQVIPGIAHHVTQRGTNRQEVFRNKVDRQVYLDLVRDNVEDAGVRVGAWCLMTNHLHFVVVPERGDSLAVLFRRVQGRYSQYFNARYRRTGHLWQARFYSCVLSPRHLAVALRYVEFNPVRAGMTGSPEEYPWSSCGAHVGRSEWDGLSDRMFWEERGGEQAWREMLRQPDRPQVQHLLRRCTYAERPFGDERFVQEVEALSGRKWRRWPFERELVDSDWGLSLETLGGENRFPGYGQDRASEGSGQ